MACGAGAARTILQEVNEEIFASSFANLSPKFASSIEAGLSSKPMLGKHCLIDIENNAAILDYAAIQPRLTASGSHISAIITGGSEEGRIERLESILDTHISGWKNHLITDLKQHKIVVGYSNCVEYDIFSKERILLAGPWVKSDYLLADAAADTGKRAAKALKSII